MSSLPFPPHYGIKARGRFLLRDIALSVRFFEALVRLPNHNSVITKSPRSHELSPRSLHSSVITCVVRVSSLPFSSLVADSLDVARVCSLLLEDCSSVEVTILEDYSGKPGSNTFCVVGITYLMWKCASLLWLA
jgi:hypothetical protein